MGWRVLHIKKYFNYIFLFFKDFFYIWTAVLSRLLCCRFLNLENVDLILRFAKLFEPKKKNEHSKLKVATNKTARKYNSKHFNHILFTKIVVSAKARGIK